MTADLAEQMGDDVGFMLMPGKDPATPGRRSAARSLPFTITSTSKNPDVAAAYIDFITDANAAKVLVETDNLPAMKDAPAPPAALLDRTSSTAWKKLNDADGVIPYLDYTTPTFYDDISGAIQELLAGKRTPGGVHRGRAGRTLEQSRRRNDRSRAAPRGAPDASAARRAAPGRLPVHPAGVRGLRDVRPAAAAARGLAVALRRGTG